MNSRWIVFLLFILISFSSCSKRSIGVIVDRDMDVEIENFAFDYLSAKVKVNYTDADRDVKGNASVRIRKDSLIWISLSPGLGIEAARGIITKDSLFFLDRINNVVYIYGYKELSKKFNFNVNYKIIESIITGNMPFARNIADKIVKRADGITVSQQEGIVSVDNIINATSKKLIRLKMTEQPSNNLLEVNYSNFQWIEEAIFPYNMNVEVKYTDDKELKQTKINLEYNKVSLSDKSLKFPFNIPKKYERL